MTDNNQMPEAVSDALKSLRAVATLSEHQGILYRRADALESFWRTHAAQPVKVRMTDELERMVYFFENLGSESAKKDAAAVRAQSAEAGKVRMPKVRELLEHLDTEIGFSNKIDVLTQAALAELDAVEGNGKA